MKFHSNRVGWSLGLCIPDLDRVCKGCIDGGLVGMGKWDAKELEYDAVDRGVADEVEVDSAGELGGWELDWEERDDKDISAVGDDICVTGVWEEVFVAAGGCVGIMDRWCEDRVTSDDSRWC